MKATRLVALASALLLVVACDTTPSEPTDLSPVVTAADNGNGRGGPPGGGGDGGDGGDVAILSATLRDASTDGIESDGQGTYTDGVDDVSITINSDGQLFFQVNGSPDVRKVAIRVDDGSGTALFDGLADATLQTRNVSNEGGVDLRSLALGESSVVPVRALWFDGTVQYTLRFGRECVENVVVPDEMGLVTRTADNSWTVENGPSGRLCMRDTKGTNRPNDDTTSQVLGVTSPFELTVVEQ